MRVIAGSARRLLLKTVEGLTTRPTTDKIKETLFNMIQFSVEGAVFLDLFAGSGGIGIEALSRGALSAVFVDRDPACIDVIKENLEFTKLSENAEVYRGDTAGVLMRLGLKRRADIVFMDPPYGKMEWLLVLSVLSDRSEELLSDDAVIIVEDEINADFSEVSRYGFEIVREKQYKNNKHVFMELKI